MILVTGATGANGSEVLKRLAAAGTPVRAMVRSPKRNDALNAPGVEVVEGDFDRPETLPAALAGVERAFLVTNSTEQAERQQLDFVAAAERAGVAHLVKLSQYHAAADSPVRFLRYHAAVERAIRGSGLAWTFLRPNLFMQGLLNFAPTIGAKGEFYAAAGDARISAVDVRDIAASAVAALTGAGHAGRVYDLTGPQALTHREFAAGLSHALGRPVAYVDVPPEAMRGALVGMGMPPWQADGLVEDYAHYRRGEAEAVTTGVRDATGRPPRDFAGFARDYAPAFARRA